MKPIGRGRGRVFKNDQQTMVIKNSDSDNSCMEDDSPDFAIIGTLNSTKKK